MGNESSGSEAQEGVRGGYDSGSIEVQALPGLRDPGCWSPLSPGRSFLDLEVWAGRRLSWLLSGSFPVCDQASKPFLWAKGPIWVCSASPVSRFLS